MNLTEGQEMIFDIFSDTTKAYRHDKELAKTMKKLNRELDTAYNCFNEATDPLVIEALIYRMKELETRYSFLVKRAKTERLCNRTCPGGKMR